MALDWLGKLVVTVALVAAWGAARYAGCLTLLYAIVLLGLLTLRPAERLVMPPEWAVIVLVVLALGWAIALDHELALRHTLLFVLAGTLFGLSRRAGVDDELLGFLALGLAATSVFAIVQAAGGLERTQAAVVELAPELRNLALQRLAKGRATGTAALPGHFAALLVTAAPLLAGWLGRGPRWRRVLASGGLLLAAAGVVLSRSLAGVLAAAMIGALALATRRPRRLLLIGGAVLLAAVALGTASLRSDLGRLEPLRLRWINWRTTAWVLAHNPVLGVGLGGVGQAGLLAPAGAANITPYAHNTYLELPAELGIAGIVLVVAGTLWLGRLLAAGLRDHLPLTLAVAVVPLLNVVDFSAYAPEVLLPWAVLAGALAARVAPPVRRRLPTWLLLPVLGSALVVAAAAWRSETLLAEAFVSPAPQSVTWALAAARWAPWSSSPLLAAGSVAMTSGDPRTAEIERELTRRWWARPRSASWAEARARLLLATGRPGEALVWAREARRRAPWRGELTTLEATCRGAS